jgi:hypothetical protein
MCLGQIDANSHRLCQYELGIFDATLNVDRDLQQSKRYVSWAHSSVNRIIVANRICKFVLLLEGVICDTTPAFAPNPAEQ